MMQTGREVAINAKAILLLLFISLPSISSANILTDIPKNNPLNINWDPAPAPEDGPPISAHASRDKSLLPVQIGAILGSYLFCVCVVGIALLFIGRRLRIQIQTSVRVLDIEMVEPAFPQTAAFEPSPVSPGGPGGGSRNFSWPSPEKDTKNPYIFPSINESPTTPNGLADPYVDTRIVEADREMLQRDLEDIYAHVMEQEDAKARGVILKEMPLPPQLQRVGPVPTGPLRTDLPLKKIEKARPATLTLEEGKPKSHSRASSLISSLKSPRRKGIRGMRISSPIATPVSATFPASAASDEEPLTPRYYTPPPPPPVPKDQVPYTHSRGPSSDSAARSLAEQLSPYRNGPRHSPNPSRTSVQSQNSNRGGDPSSATSATSQTPLFLSAPKPRHLQLNSQAQAQPSNPPSTNSSSRALPFRSFEPALQSPSFVPTTKTTVLERNIKPNGPQTGGLKTPWSAGAVPYSPYQPFSPMIPITPRLVTKEERKQKKKEEGRTPVLEMIKSEDDLWDSGY
ncbi:hypothetical protein ONS95_004657 [Cadophora gregata]|uniref:uncharacterized protein n=1 Tax=Cadophora gregata TaxID=51156 RepID=UPI0026DAB64B|nr:uncharacterized protein ONS95_004657 [Cadophora gregata]KAK0099447.1 hypothetical protein ONS96_008284 [Cadophora gregata f. sp. sojae]KAK0104361.1 hypothetical protein ONS95_004657 [Cadophora gregata]